MKIGIWQIGTAIGAVGTATGIGLGTAALVKHEDHTDKTSELEKALYNKSDLTDDIIDLKDSLMVGELAPSHATGKIATAGQPATGIIHYVNQETKQEVSMQLANLYGNTAGDIHRFTDLEYKRRLNVNARLMKRGEEFVGHLAANDSITYIFNADDSNPINIIKVKFESTGTSGTYNMGTSLDNLSVFFKHSKTIKMTINGTIEPPMTSKTKADLFLGGNIPSVGVTYHSPSGFNTQSNPLPGTTHQPPRGEEILTINYHAHIGYAFHRAIVAATALYDWIDQKKADKEHTHP